MESDLKKYMREGINNKMIKKYDIIGFEKAEKKITKLITKFGGQPIGFDSNNGRFEYIPILKEGSDPEFITSSKYQKLDDNERSRYNELVDTDKIGGMPNFFRGDEWPEGEWKLLLQLHCNFQPFVLNLGAMPILFVFISSDFKNAGLLVQC